MALRGAKGTIITVLYHRTTRALLVEPQNFMWAFRAHLDLAGRTFLADRYRILEHPSDSSRNLLEGQTRHCWERLGLKNAMGRVVRSTKFFTYLL